MNTFKSKIIAPHIKKLWIDGESDEMDENLIITKIDELISDYANDGCGLHILFVNSKTGEFIKNKNRITKYTHNERHKYFDMRMIRSSDQYTLFELMSNKRRPINSTIWICICDSLIMKESGAIIYACDNVVTTMNKLIDTIKYEEEK